MVARLIPAHMSGGRCNQFPYGKCSGMSFAFGRAATTLPGEIACNRFKTWQVPA